MDKHFRVATYNIHKARGLDLRIVPERIVEVVLELNADILCLQEVMNVTAGQSNYDQAREIQRALPGFTCAFGSNRQYRGGAYGNLTLSRFPCSPPAIMTCPAAVANPAAYSRPKLKSHLAAWFISSMCTSARATWSAASRPAG